MYGNQETIDFDHVMDPEIGRIVIQCRTKLYGRYVQIARTGSTGSLSLCEVKVWGRNCAEEINRAVQKPVQYSSLTRSSSVMFLTDGGGKSNFETALEDQPYVIVDLTAAYFIDAFFVEAGKVSMYNLNISTSVSRNMSSFQVCIAHSLPNLWGKRILKTIKRGDDLFKKHLEISRHPIKEEDATLVRSENLLALSG